MTLQCSVYRSAPGFGVNLKKADVHKSVDVTPHCDNADKGVCVCGCKRKGGWREAIGNGS